jgi:glycosyltransferase involved in cell wall biosynthesis
LFVTRSGALDTGGGQFHKVSARFHALALKQAEWTSFVVPLPSGISILRKAKTFVRLHKGYMMGIHEGLIEAFDRKLDHVAPQAVLFDTSLFGPLALRAKRRGCIVITQSHNCEYDYFAGEAALRGGLSAGHLRAVHLAESMAVEATDILLTVSEYDRQRFAQIYGSDNNILVVNPMLSDLRERLALAPHLLRSGTLDSMPSAVFIGSAWHQNRFACRLLARHWQGTQAQLSIVGEVGKWIKREINAADLHDRRINVAGFVESVDRVLGAADTMVCPMQLGSGVKIKMIEALANDCPVLASIEALHGFEFAEASGYVRPCSFDQMEAQTAQARGWVLCRERLGLDLAKESDAQLARLREKYVSYGLCVA